MDHERFSLPSTEDLAKVYYTNATKLAAQSPIGTLEKLRIEGLLQQNAILGATSEVWCSQEVMKPEQVAVLISRAFYQTNNPALTLAPEFTLCFACQTLTPGLVSECPNCSSTKLDVLALAATNYSRVSTWPRWKAAEFKLRNRELVP